MKVSFSSFVKVFTGQTGRPKKLTGPIMPVGVHPHEENRNFVDYHILSSKQIPELTPALELIEQHQRVGILFYEEANKYAIYDNTGGFSGLSQYVLRLPDINRFLMTGGSVPGCLASAFTSIVRDKITSPSSRIDFYFPLDGTFVFDEEAKVDSWLFRGYFDKIKSCSFPVAVWVDDQLPTEKRWFGHQNDANPQVNIFVYTSTQKMIKALR